MFTGIITDIGRLLSVVREGDWTLAIATTYDVSSIALGASIACNGICLTVTGTGTTPEPHFTVQASQETRDITTLGHWQEGEKLNLERALKLGDELGGHMVSGHVDGLATLLKCENTAESLQLTFEAPADLAPFIARKGSVALNGVSLTVNAVESQRFSVNIIPHTQTATTLGALREGDKVNLEVDMMARYAQRLLER